MPRPRLEGEHMPSAAPPDFSSWIGRSWVSEDVVAERLVASFRAIFEPTLAALRDGVAPLGIHWCLSPEIAPMSALGPDGHPAKNLHLPPVPQPRRMWAGGSLELIDALRTGDKVRRETTIAEVKRKEGRTGELWFIGLDHIYSTPRGIAIRERQSLVYREAASSVSGARGGPAGATPSAGAPAATEESTRQVSRRWQVATTPTYLFRYSAITFNGHRIHYDPDYARDIEGYAGLVVHGPIQATLLLNLAAADLGESPRRLQYRGISPCIAGGTLEVCVGSNTAAGMLWTRTPHGPVHMEAQATAA